MKIKIIYSVIMFMLILILSINSVVAETEPQPSHSDNRIQITTYDPNQVYKLTCMLGYTTAIQFGEDEHVLAVNIGDSSSYLVNVQNDIINMKPVTAKVSTNMNVITSRGTYQFFITTTDDHDNSSSAHVIFLLRFRYPQTAAANQNLTNSFNLNKPLIINSKYTARGNTAVVPKSVYDNGHFTYFDFSNLQNIPAIFTVDSQGLESIVNYHVKNNTVIVETIARQFTLRDGNQVATIFNESTSS